MNYSIWAQDEITQELEEVVVSSSRIDLPLSENSRTIKVIQAQEIQRLKEILNKILAKNCGKTVKQIEKDTERDNFMSAEDSVKYGIIDKVIEKH